MRHGRRAGDAGVATVWAVGLIAALCAATGLLLWFGAATEVRHRAVNAADLSALAAAAHAPMGTDYACGRARWVAERMRVDLTYCALHGWDAVVEVAIRPPAILSDTRPALARARAGPADGGAWAPGPETS